MARGGGSFRWCAATRVRNQTSIFSDPTDPSQPFRTYHQEPGKFSNWANSKTRLSCHQLRPNDQIWLLQLKCYGKILSSPELIHHGFSRDSPTEFRRLWPRAMNLLVICCSKRYNLSSLHSSLYLCACQCLSYWHPKRESRPRLLRDTQRFTLHFLDFSQ